MGLDNCPSDTPFGVTICTIGWSPRVGTSTRVTTKVIGAIYTRIHCIFACIPNSVAPLVCRTWVGVGTAHASPRNHRSIVSHAITRRASFTSVRLARIAIRRACRAWVGVVTAQARSVRVRSSIVPHAPTRIIMACIPDGIAILVCRTCVFTADASVRIHCSIVSRASSVVMACIPNSVAPLVCRTCVGTAHASVRIHGGIVSRAGTRRASFTSVRPRIAIRRA
jgi:hypothetical protein